MTCPTIIAEHALWAWNMSYDHELCLMIIRIVLSSSNVPYDNDMSYDPRACLIFIRHVLRPWRMSHDHKICSMLMACLMVRRRFLVGAAKQTKLSINRRTVCLRQSWQIELTRTERRQASTECAIPRTTNTYWNRQTERLLERGSVPPTSCSTSGMIITICSFRHHK